MVNPFLLAAVCVLNFMVILFVVAVLLKDNSVVDIGWGIGFIVVTSLVMYHSETLFPKQKLVLFLVAMWGVRLSSYICIRHWGHSEDFKYSRQRAEWGDQTIIKSFFRIFLWQGLIMFVMCLPLVVINATPRTLELKSLYPIGGALWAIGYFIESLADLQLFYFKDNPAHDGHIFTKGLWRFSRHPNYFGEALLWWGIFIISIPSGYWYLTIWSPIAITFLLLRISGIPRTEQKYEGNETYELYKSKTNAFIPWIPKRV